MADQALVVTEDDVRAMLLAGDSIVGQAGRSMQVIDYLEQGNSESSLMLEGAHRSFYYTAWRAPHRAAWQRTSEVLGVRQKIRVDCRGAGQVPHARLETSKAMRIVPREAPWTARGLVVNA